MVVTAASDASGLAMQVVRGRWFMVFACFLIMAAAGATYIFSIYSNDIKTSLGYDQQTLNTLSFFKDLGANVGVVSGLINEVTPPWVVLCTGAGMNLFGYLMIYLAITQRIARPAVWQMCLYICVGANSQTFANASALVNCVKNFPESRGVVLGLLKGFVGLSGVIITQLYLAFYIDDFESLVLLIAWLPAAISVVSVHIIRIMKMVRQANELKVIYSFLCISLALTLAGYLIVMIVVEKRAVFSRPEYGANAAIVLFLLVLVLAIVVKEELSLRKQINNQALENPLPISIAIAKPVIAETKPTPVPTTAASSAPETTSTRKTLAVLSRVSHMFSPSKRREYYSILQVLVSIDMLILFVATICAAGGMLTAIDNMGQIGESLGYQTRSISTFVSVINASREISGFASEIFLAKYKFPRPLMLTGVLVLSLVGHLFIAFGVPASLYVASVIIGFCFGALSPLLFAIISEIFGLKYCSTLYNLAGVARPIGSYIFKVRVAGALYDSEAAKPNYHVASSAGKDVTCIGVQCFRLSFLIIAGATIMGALASLVLVWKQYKNSVEDEEVPQEQYMCKVPTAGRDADDMALISGVGQAVTQLVMPAGDATYFGRKPANECRIFWFWNWGLCLRHNE